MLNSRLLDRSKLHSNRTVVEAGKFGIVGIANTLIDFAILNVLTFSFGLPRIKANYISTTVAMIFSFTANRRLVFSSNSRNYKRQISLFFVFTTFSLYILQPLVIYFFSNIWTSPAHLTHAIFDILGVDLNKDFIITNVAKTAATAVSLVWNFISYKKYVFRK